MNQDLAQIVMYYATKPHNELNTLLLNKSKDNLVASLTDLLTSYINDKNSSSLREFVTISIAGYEHNTNKLGYNGYKHNSAIGSKPIMCEAKPKNIQTIDFETKKTKPKLNGQGNFSDYTKDRLNKDLKENLHMLSSGFIDGELIYIIEFPFKTIKKRLLEQLPAERKIGEYLRSANFTFVDYKDDKKLRMVYLNKKSLENNEKYFNKAFYIFLKNKS